MNEELIMIYQNRYKNISLKQVVVIIVYVLFVLFVGYRLIENHLYWLCALFCILMVLGAFAVGIMFQWQYAQNLSFVNDILMEQLDLERTKAFYETLMNMKKKRDYPYILVQYLNILLIGGQFQTFKDVYINNQKVVQKSLVRMLRIFKENFIFLQENQALYEQVYQEHRFSKYRYEKAELSQKNASLRFQDEIFEVRYLYYTKQYEEALKMIETIHPVMPYHELLVRCYRACIHYHLHQLTLEDETIIEQYPQFLCVQRLEYLLDTGEDMMAIEADTMIRLIESDQKIGQRKMRKKGIIFLIFILLECVLIFSIGHLEVKYTNFQEGIERLDITVKDIYNLYEDDQMATAIFYGYKDSMSFYYLGSLSIKNGNLMSEHYISVGFMFDETEIYQMEGNGKNYISLVIHDGEDVYYNGEKQDVMISEIPILGGSTQMIASFVIEGEFNETLIEARGV